MLSPPLTFQLCEGEMSTQKKYQPKPALNTQYFHLHCCQYESILFAFPPLTRCHCKSLENSLKIYRESFPFSRWLYFRNCIEHFFSSIALESFEHVSNVIVIRFQSVRSIVWRGAKIKVDTWNDFFPLSCEHYQKYLYLEKVFICGKEKSIYRRHIIENGANVNFLKRKLEMEKRSFCNALYDWKYAREMWTHSFAPLDSLKSFSFFVPSDVECSENWNADFTIIRISRVTIFVHWKFCFILGLNFVKQPMPISVDTNSNQKCDLRIRNGLMYKMNVRMYVTFYEQLFTENCNRRRRHVNVNSKNGYEEIIFWFFFSSFARLEIVNVNTMNAIAFWKLEYVSILVSSFGIGQPNIFFFLSWIHLGTIPMTRSSSNIQPPC